MSGFSKSVITVSHSGFLNVLDVASASRSSGELYTLSNIITSSFAMGCSTTQVSLAVQQRDMRPSSSVVTAPALQASVIMARNVADVAVAKGAVGDFKDALLQGVYMGSFYVDVGGYHVNCSDLSLGFLDSAPVDAGIVGADVDASFVATRENGPVVVGLQVTSVCRLTNAVCNDNFGAMKEFSVKGAVPRDVVVNEDVAVTSVDDTAAYRRTDISADEPGTETEVE